MTIDMICVHDTDYSEYFENAGKNAIFLLREEAAEKVWNKEVHTNSSSYFDLPEDCWIIAIKNSPIGDWMEAYNNDDNVAVEKLLRGTFDWQDNRIVRFFAKKKIVFQTRWYDFLIYWDEFLAIEDDCPIVIPENGSGKEAIIFRPVGDIIKIGRDDL